MMYVETVKSFILWILIGISLLLTFALWSYQPELDTLDQDFENRVDIGGKEKTKSSLIEPESFIFKINNNYYSFTDPRESHSLYQDMHEWVLYEAQSGNSNGVPSDEQQVEINFPDDLPVEVAKKLFTFNKEINLPEWSFKRMFITFNRDSNSFNIIFLSVDNQRQVKAVVNNSERFARLWEYLTTFEGLTEYVQIKGAGSPFYIPKYQVEIPRSSVAVNTINSSQMVDELFTNPDIVRENYVKENQIYYTDSQRGIMYVYENRRTMEFQNPLQIPYESMSPSQLIDKSITNINEHRGWTNEYNLMELDTSSNTIKFQLYYGGYPVYGNNNSTVIEQQYRASELNQYKRPLYSLSNFLGGSTETLSSGNDVKYILENSKNYDLKNITNIKVGYQLSYRKMENAIDLDPAWFMNYNGSWRTIDLEEIQIKGGS